MKETGLTFTDNFFTKQGSFVVTIENSTSACLTRAFQGLSGNPCTHLKLKIYKKMVHFVFTVAKPHTKKLYLIAFQKLV